MSDLGYPRAVTLGVIQGLTEFLPISSSGHLAIAQRWMDLEPTSSSMLLFDILAHLGTLVAVAIVFARVLKRFGGRLLREIQREHSGDRYGWRIAWLAIVACIPTALIGVGFKRTFQEAFDKPAWIGAGLLVTGILLAATAPMRRTSRGWKRFTWWQAALVGTAQGMAILPGISRSGATICVALGLGLRRRWAAEFSFLIAAPAILGGACLEILDTFELPSDQIAQVAWGAIAAGSVASLLVGVVALTVLLQVVRRAKLHLFALYCWLVGILILTGVA